MHWTISMLDMLDTICTIGFAIGMLGLLTRKKRLAFLFCGFISSALLVAINAIQSDVPEAIFFISVSLFFLYWIGKVKGMKWTENRIVEVILLIILLIAIFMKVIR